jgi:hypothetical protein
MSLYIEYYEVGSEYYYMPVDSDAKNKENYDNRSSRVWRFNTRTNRIEPILDRSKGLPEIDPAEFFKIQLIAKPVPYDEYYLRLQEVKQRREQREAEKSFTLDQVQDT